MSYNHGLCFGCRQGINRGNTHETEMNLYVLCVQWVDGDGWGDIHNTLVTWTESCRYRQLLAVFVGGYQAGDTDSLH